MSLPVDFAKVQNVLILRTDHLGDLLLSTPLIRTLRTTLPGRRFTLVTSPANTGALDGWDAIDDCRVFDPSWSAIKKLEFIKTLRQTRWDLCLTLSPRTLPYILGWLSGAPIRTGIVYSRRILARLLSPLFFSHPVVLALDSMIDAGQSVPHEVDQMMRIATVLGLTPNAAGPLEFPLRPAEVVWAQNWLSSQAGSSPPCLIGVHGAGKWLAQDWTAQDFLLLLRQLAVVQPSGKVLVTFGPGDRQLQNSLKELLTPADRISILLAEQYPIERWGALLSRCNVVVSPDTGSLHLAVALGRPVIAMYESDSFSHCSSQWAPWQVPAAIVRRSAPAVTVPIFIAETARLLHETGACTK